MGVVDKFRLDNKVAVVTGALGNLGFLWCKTLLEAGAAVAGVDLHDKAVSESFSRLKDNYKNIELFKADVTVKENLLRVRHEIVNKLGTVDILVNNAGIDQPPSDNIKTYGLFEMTEENFSKVFDVNVTGAFHCIQAFGEEMAKNKKGVIINIGSLYAGVSPVPELYSHIHIEPPFLKPPAYGASKAALINLTKYFAVHLADKGIRVNSLSPGGVEGSQDEDFKAKYCEKVPLKRMAQFEDLEGPFLFLASEASSYITGLDLVVDGGFTVI